MPIMIVMRMLLISIVVCMLPTDFLNAVQQQEQQQQALDRKASSKWKPRCRMVPLIQTVSSRPMVFHMSNPQVKESLVSCNACAARPTSLLQLTVLQP